MPPRTAADPLVDRRLLLFTGKGGVGKSTIVAGLAAAAAARGQRPLVVELGHRASMSGLLGGGQAIGHEPAAIAGDGRLWAINIDREAALFDHVLAQVKVRRLARMIIDNPALRGLLRAAPMVRELVTLTKLAALVGEREGGGPRWQPILVDLDASGHALMLLDLPRVLRQLSARGPLAALGRRLAGLLGDPAQALLILVTLAREVPAQETIELAAAIDRRGLAVGGLVINQIPAAPVPERLRPTLAEAQARAPVGSPLAAELALAARLIADTERAQAARERLRGAFAGVPQAEAGERDRMDGDALARLGAEVLAGMAAWPAAEGPRR